MSKKFTIRTENGKPNSLKSSVRIAFTLTPSGESAHPYDPIARSVTTFHAGSERTESISWSSEVKFSSYRLKARKVEWNSWSENTVLPTIYAQRLLLYVVYFQTGRAVTLTNVWSDPALHFGLGSASAMAINRSGSKQDVTLLARVAYRPLNDGQSIVAPCNWKLQAYIVTNNITEWCILRPEDLQRPIFPTAISCDALPNVSSWTLCQDSEGIIEIRNDKYLHLGYPPEKAVKKTGISQILERLDMMAESISRIRDDVASGQQAMADMQTQLSTLQKSADNTETRLSGLDSSVFAIQSKATALTESFAQSQSDLTSVKSSTNDIKQLLTGADEPVGTSGSQPLHLNYTIPAVPISHLHDRLTTLEDATGRTNNRVDMVEKSLNQTQEQVSLIEQVWATTESRLLHVGEAPGGTFLDVLPAAQTQATLTDPRVPALEAQTAQLEKALAETKRQLVSAQNTIHTMSNRIPIVESKAEKLGNLLRQTQTELTSVHVFLARLDCRVADAEARAVEVDLLVGDSCSGGRDSYFTCSRGSP